jgi:two-component system response regulator PilR (NtrC family)
MDKEVFDLVVTDMAMPGMTGLELLKKIKSLSADTAVIVITAYGTTESAIEAMKSGAFDYISKPFNNEAIKLTIFKCLQTRLLERENLMLKRQMKMENRFGNLIGSSDAMKEVFELIQVVRNNRSNVIITGESGTGKEIVAREIHFGGDLADQPFVTVNCGAIPENLMESELFGHMRGAFTGAVSNRRGLFRSANGGTIFLDEIGELPVQMQVKLLRVIQTKIVRPVGSAEDFSIDVRIIAATNQDLEQAVKKGQFREDLYFRLNVIHIRVPALKDRSEDIPSLTHYFVTKISKELGKKVLKVNQETLDLLQQYSFPGNIRELENILERGIALEKSPILLPESLPDYLRGYGGSVRDDGSDPKGKSQISLPPEGIDLEKEMDALERHFLEESLKSAKGVKTKAAKLLKLTFRSFRYRLEKHHLD